MTAELTRRDNCVVCGAGDLFPIVTIPRFPVYQGCVRAEFSTDECAPMSWGACEACGSAQIVALPRLERIYQAGHATGLGQAWARHHQAFARFVKEHVRGPVVDVGGGSGTLAAAYRSANGDDSWTILEPNALKSPSLPSNVEVVDGFLDVTTLKRLDAATVVMCHMLEHVVDLRAALADLNEALPEHGTVIIAWPELETWVKRGLAGALNFEHGFYVGVPRLKALFAEFGWRLSQEAQWTENETIFLAFVRGKPDPVQEAPPRSAIPLIADYFEGFRNRAITLGRALDCHDGDAFLMPASVYAQALIASGLAEDRFAALLDNAPIKQRARLCGTKLKVTAPSVRLAQARRPLVILNGGPHDSEMAQGLRMIRPEVEVLRVQSMRLYERQVLHSDREKIAQSRPSIPQIGTRF